MQALRSLISTSVHNPVLANVLTVCILIGGVVSAQRIARETYPEFSLDRIQVEVAYPGAGPTEVENGVCTKVEQAIQGVVGVKEVQSFSRENYGHVVAELLDTVKDPAPVLQDIRNKVEQITTLPKDADRPVVTEMVYRTQVINVAVHGNVPERALRELAVQVRDDLLADKEVGAVTLSGVREHEISIEISEEALQQYGLAFADVLTAVSRNTLDLPAGVLRTRDEEISLRTVGQRYTAREFEDMVLIASPDGTLVRLHQVAAVKEGFEEITRQGRFNGEPAALVSVYKTGNQDAIRIAERVRRYVERRQATLPDSVKLSVWADASKEISDRTAMLINDGVTGMILAVALLTLFLNLRLSLYVAIGIPVSFAGALIALYWMGQTLNMISLLGLIITTGIVVDDSIVICDRFDQRRRRGESTTQSAIEGTWDVALPVVGSALATSVAFLPMLYVTGVMGKLIAILPVVVIVALAASQLEAFTALPAHLAHGPPPRVQSESWHTRLRAGIDRRTEGFITGVYRPVCRRATEARSLTVLITLAVVILLAGLYLGGRAPLVLFPEIDSNTLRARVQFPEGTPADVTQAAVARIEQAAAGLGSLPELKPASGGPLVQRTFSILGEHSDFTSSYGSHLADVVIELMPSEQRSIDCGVILNCWRRTIGSIPNVASLVLSRVQPGPTEKPLEVRLFGDNLDRLDAAAEELKGKLAEFDGVYDIADQLTPGKRELRIELKPAARGLGMTLDDLGRQVRSGFFGGEALRVQRGRDEVTVRVRYPDAQRGGIADIERMHIRTSQGNMVPFREVADVRMARGYSSIESQNGKRRCRVYANLDERTTNAERILETLQAGFLPDLADRHDVSYSLEGQHAQIIESVGSLLRGFLIAMVVNYAILAAMLRSYLQPLLIMSVVPLGFLGGVLGHWLLGYDLTLMSLFGMVALGGIVVNDSLALVDQVNVSMRAGVPILEAVRQAGEIRFRAVVLTAISDVAGVLPLLLDRSTQAQTVIPMALSLACGLVVATVVTLLVLPSLYLLVYDAKNAVRRLWGSGPGSSGPLVQCEGGIASDPREA